MNSLSCWFITCVLDSNNIKMNSWMKNEFPFLVGTYVIHMLDSNNTQMNEWMMYEWMKNENPFLVGMSLICKTLTSSREGMDDV